MGFRSRFLLPALAALALPLSACSDGSGPSGDGTARVSVHLTDAPGDILAAVVTISEIYLQGSGGKTVLSSTPVTTDLTLLANATATLVDEVEIPEGTYSELRFVITGGYIEVEDGAGGSEIYATSPTYAGLPAGAQVDGELQMPSFGASGLKVQFDGAQTLSIGADEDLLVDFDVSQSFGKQAGNSGRWVMQPVVKGASLSQAGTVLVRLSLGTGVTLPNVGGNPVTLAAFKARVGTEELAFTDPDGDGIFEARFRFLLPGTYDVSLVLPAGLGATANLTLPVQVDLAAGETETVTIVLTGATAL